MLPPGPRAPAAVQTLEWVGRPTALLRRCAARYGDPFTLRTAWADGPMVLTAQPEEARRVFAADPAVLRGGEGAAILEPFTGPRSILLLDGAEHLRQRRLMLGPFHGERMAGHRAAIAGLAAAEVARWPRGVPVATLPRMTLEVIVRVVFGLREGAELDALRAAIRRAIDLTTTLPRLVAMTLVQRDLGPHSPWGAFHRAVADLDARLHAVLRRRDPEPGSILATLLEARHEDGSPPSDAELRDQLVTLLAAGHETTAGALAWALERLARHPRVLARVRAGDEAYCRVRQRWPCR